MTPTEQKLREALELCRRYVLPRARAFIDAALAAAPERPALPSGWHMERYDEPNNDGSHWSAWRERDGATVTWWDEGDIGLDVLVDEDSKATELLAVLTCLQWHHASHTADPGRAATNPEE
jgi:hypothetical protein